MVDFDDGWGNEMDDKQYVMAYENLEFEVFRKIDRVLEKANLAEFRPKYKHQKQRKNSGRKNDDEDWRNAIYNLPELHNNESSDENEEQKLFFKPPLQVQRNTFVKNQLLDFKWENRVDLSKICIMGCGEMSLERFLIENLASFGVKMVLSVDLDEKSLSIGQQLFETRLAEQSAVLKEQHGFPILIRSFVGNILDLDYRFSNADCIISLEVIEHMPLASAKQFIDQVLRHLRPRIFIFSTPNNDYNEVFGDEPGTFRHDDHYFEMKIDEFAEYHRELSEEFRDSYEIQGPLYIGQIFSRENEKKFENLKGATQAMVCKLKTDLMGDVEPGNLVYQSTHQTMVPIGMKPVIYRLIKKAFFEFLEHFSFCPMALSNVNGFSYWRIDIKNILHRIRAPVSFLTSISEIEALQICQNLSHHKISIDIKENEHHSIIIPDFMKKEELLEMLS
ncbi:unnamed protein product [Caenorhabditis angaria]|uniref:Small RNA 2'-O-methyltransferase n=1 Tax=Caenorhabditis angaria TaxID=860376 RepID=A0A9P1IL71_9PELO|nr:unnamed protein product [Caenorhabditis angaria]